MQKRNLRIFGRKTFASTVLLEIIDRSHGVMTNLAEVNSLTMLLKK